MLNILVVTLAGDPSTVFGVSDKIAPRLIQRAAVHESRTVEDAIESLSTDWPNAILVQSNLILDNEELSTTLRNHLIERTRNGCATIFMGYFHWPNYKMDALEALFKDHFELKWELVTTNHVLTDLVENNPGLLRTTVLSPIMQNQDLLLRGVPREQAVYRARQQPERLASVAFAAVGSGRVGFIGGGGDEVDRLVLAMCGLDRPTDAPGNSLKSYHGDH